MLSRAVQSALWSPEGAYLDVATYGLAATPTLAACTDALEGWRTGAGDWHAWTRATEPARASWARLAGVPAERVAVGSTVSGLLGLLPRALPDGARVVLPDGEFSSALFPWLAERRLDVVEVPVAALADAVVPGTAAVCFSLVRSSDGSLVDGPAVSAAARAAGALSVVDVTQAVGWHAFDGGLYDAVVGGAYKWGCSPRGSAFLYVTEQLQERVVPSGAGWFAGDDVFGTFYGSPLRLASDARSLDVSPAWFSWVGTAAALAVLEDLGLDAVEAHDLAVADRFRELVGLPPGCTPVVSLEAPGADEELTRRGVRASVRGGRLRVSFHAWTTTDDAELAAEAVQAARG